METMIVLSQFNKIWQHALYSVNDTINSDDPIQGAVDTFNHIGERTNTGWDVSNDTVLVIYSKIEKVLLIELLLIKKVKPLVSNMVK